MKRLWIVLLALLMLQAAALAEDMEVNPRYSVLEIARMRPESEEPTHLTVGNTTKVSGSFWTTYFGNNTSDIDVRTMLHGYSPVVWDNQVQFVPDPQVTTGITRDRVPGGTAYTVSLQHDLTYNDGTPITARDYVFAWLLTASPQLAAISAETPDMNVVGFDAYHDGETPVFAGIRLVDEYTYRIVIHEEYDPYFYDYAQIALSPYPESVLAPGFTVADDGQGAYITGTDGGELTAELLEKTVLDPETGYLSHPWLSCGPYSLTGYDRAGGVVDFALNPYYKGNYEGVKPVIDTITLVPVLPEDMVAKLESGEVGLLNKCVDASVIDEGIELTGRGPFDRVNYARLGYGFCAFSCEKDGPQQFVAVRQALNYAFDSERFITEILGGYGTPVYGYYGIGQWMVSAVNGSVRPMNVDAQELARWDALSLDQLNPYPYDVEKAKELLEKDGWTLAGDGTPYDEEKGGLRYKQTASGLMPLRLHFAKGADNAAADKVLELFGESLPQIGAEFDVEEVPFTELLSDYYREGEERRFDMNFMATNFFSTFDPYITFSARPDMQGSVNTSGIDDAELVRLSWEMRKTNPGDLLTFLQRWIRMQERFNEILPTMPIYSNIYFDFFESDLQNYRANAEYSWPVAILYSYLGEPIELPQEEPAFEEEPEAEEESAAEEAAEDTEPADEQSAAASGNSATADPADEGKTAHAGDSLAADGSIDDDAAAQPDGTPQTGGDAAAVQAQTLTAEGGQIVAIRSEQNVGAYRRATPKSNFVGWAKAGGHYSVLETVKGYNGREWIRVQLENGAEGFIPARMTTPVVQDAESLTRGYVRARYESDVPVRRKPEGGALLMGMARKGTIYPVIGEKVYGWWPIALEDGTTGYVYQDAVYETGSPEGDGENHVTFSGRSIIYAEPTSDSAVLTGIGPDAALRCVRVIPHPSYTDKTGEEGFDWYEVETLGGGYGYVSSRNAALVEGALPQ
ncbi:MAG: hypothetical protein IJ175_08640 [Clostridia bacterium]|nr:hypothetical protein [Clostridia bacterium]